MTGALDITSGGLFAAPPGYPVIVDDIDTPSTVVGGSTLFGGDGNITFVNTTGAGSIVAGNGNDLFSLVPGSTYNVATGSGADTFVAAGQGTVYGGTGHNAFFVGGQNYIVSDGSNDAIIDTAPQTAGASTIVAAGNNVLVGNVQGQMDLVLAGTGTASVVSGSGTETIFGAQNTLVLGGNGGLFFVAGSGTASTIVGGAGQSTIFGASDGDSGLCGQHRVVRIRGLADRHRWQRNARGRRSERERVLGRVESGRRRVQHLDDWWFRQ